MNTPTIARNSLWYGVETAIMLVSGILTSIVIARALGPVKLGHYTYIAWLVNITASIGALGVPSATSKYMGEYLGRGEAPVARAIFFDTLRLQTCMATLLTLIAICIAWFATAPDMRWTAVLLSAAMWPAMVIWIPSQANMARENMFANVPSALLSNMIYVIGVILTVIFSRDTVGLAATLLTMRSAELLMRIVPVLRWMRGIPYALVPAAVRRRLINFSFQSTILMLLAIIVFDRSEVILLRYFSDIRQLAFYTVVFNVTERLRSLPQVFSSAVGATMIAQYGRNPANLKSILSGTIRYLALMAAPVHVGLAILSGPIILFTYGSKYSEAIPLMAVASLLALPRVVLAPVSSLLAATDRQDLSIKWGLWMAALNIALDFALIPKFGGMGAVLANGVAQTVAVVGLCWFANDAAKLAWPIAALSKIGFASAAMAAAVLFLPHTHSHGLDVLLGICVGIVIFFAMIKMTRVLDETDRDRLALLGNRLPSAFRSSFARLVELLAPQLRRQAAVL
jgi:O-antigen/teichoic acid export membrane protein